MSTSLTSGLGGLLPPISIPLAPPTSDPQHLLDGLNLLNLSGLDILNLGSALSHTAISTQGLALTLPTGIDLGGVLGTDHGDIIHLAANTVLGSAELGLGDDQLIGTADSIVNGVIDAAGGNDTITVGSGSSTLRGGEGDDIVTVIGSGDNVLDGGSGADTMSGGVGDDTYMVDDRGDQVREMQNQGNDTVHASISYTLGDNVENLVLAGQAAIDGTGNAGNNALTGNNAANLLDGANGDDVMSGGDGDDTYVVESAGDRVSEAVGQGLDSVRASVSYTLGQNVENLILTGHDALTGRGNELANMLQGNDAANVLDGKAGADVMVGGGGNDTYYVDHAGDRVIEQAGAGTDTVRSTISYVLGDNVETLRLGGSVHLDGTGNALSNTIYGNGSVNHIDGGAGADRMFGGDGNDTYVVDNVGDRVIEKAGEGTDSVRSSVNFILSDNVENLTLTGSSATNGTGNSLNNVIYGNDAGDRLNGAAGNDRIVGGSGNDTVIGGGGKDLLTGGGGADRFVFGSADFGGKTAGTADVVKDFSHAQGDKIDLSAVDADTGRAGNQAFAFIGDHAFTGAAGQLAVQHIDGGYFLAGDMNGDRHADFLVKLTGLDGYHVTSADIVL